MDPDTYVLLGTLAGCLTIFTITMIIFPCCQHCRGDKETYKNKVKNLKIDGKIFFDNEIARKYKNDKKYNEKIKNLKSDAPTPRCQKNISSLGS